MANKTQANNLDETIKVVIDKRTLFALASETRIKILKRLDKRRMTLTELSESLNASKSTVKEHLEKLIDAGLVMKIDEGRKWIYYELTEKGKRILHPNNLTKIVLLLSISIAFVIAGLIELAKFIGFRFITPTSTSTSTSTPVPMPVPMPTSTPTLSTHAPEFVGLILIATGILLLTLLLAYCFKLK